MDESLGILAMRGIGVDTTSDPLETKLLPLGDSIEETVALAKDAVDAALQKDVTPEQFKEVQSQLMVVRKTFPPPLHMIKKMQL